MRRRAARLPAPSQRQAGEATVSSTSEPYFRRQCLCARATTPDGNSLFRALSDQLTGSQRHHLEVRRAVVDYLEAHPQVFAPYVTHVKFWQHCQNMRRSGEVPGHIELRAAGLLFRVHICLHVVEDEQRGHISILRIENPWETLSSALFASVDDAEEAALEGSFHSDCNENQFADDEEDGRDAGDEDGTMHRQCSAAAVADALVTARGRVLHLVLRRGVYGSVRSLFDRDSKPTRLTWEGPIAAQRLKWHQRVKLRYFPQGLSFTIATLALAALGIAAWAVLSHAQTQQLDG